MHPLLRTLLFTFAVPGTVMVILPLWLVGPGVRVEWRSWHTAGLLPMAIGAAIYFWCAWDFAMRGRGSPGPWDPPRKLVVHGLYRWVRNPMYIGVCMVGLGEALLFGSPAIAWYVLLFWCCTNLFIFLYEEPTLRRLFGAEYEDYCRRVPRWIPRKPAAVGGPEPK